MPTMTLRAARKKMFLSQRELAERSGVSRATIAHIETGKTRPYPKTARALAEALDLPPGDIAWPEVPEEAVSDGD